MKESTFRRVKVGDLVLLTDTPIGYSRLANKIVRVIALKRIYPPVNPPFAYDRENSIWIDGSKHSGFSRDECTMSANDIKRKWSKK